MRKYKRQDIGRRYTRRYTEVKGKGRKQDSPGTERAEKDIGARIEKITYCAFKMTPNSKRKFEKCKLGIEEDGLLWFNLIRIKYWYVEVMYGKFTFPMKGEL